MIKDEVTDLIFVVYKKIIIHKIYFLLGLWDNQNSYITIMQHIITIITIAMLHKIHKDMVLRCVMLE